MKRFITPVAIILATCAIVDAYSWAATARADAAESALSRTFARVHGSLVLVRGFHNEEGTGFVLGTDTKQRVCYVLTAAHVVGPARRPVVTLYDDVNDPSDKRIASVIRKSTEERETHADRPELDLALLTIDHCDLKPLYVPWEATEGTRVAVAGYPVSSHIALELFGELRPTLHEGVVSAIRLHGLVVEHSAVTDYGNSGGPLFDADTGYVLGIVEGKLGQSASGAYIATGFSAINTFLDGRIPSSALPCPPSFEGATPMSYAVAPDLGCIPITDLPPPAGSRRLLFVSAARANADLNAYEKLDDAVQSHLREVFGNDIQFVPQSPPGFNFASTQQYVQNSTPVSMRGACAKDAVGVVYFNPGVSVTGQTALVAPNLALLTCRGNVLRSSSWRKGATAATLEAAQTAAIDAKINQFIDQATADFAFKVRREPTRFRNFLTFGWFIADDEDASFFDWYCQRPCSKNHTVVKIRYLDPGGTAARAGLRLGDVVERINCHSAVTGHTDSVLAYEQEPYWVLDVRHDRGDARQLSRVYFPSEDLRWYATHPGDQKAPMVKPAPCPVNPKPLAALGPSVDFNPVIVQGTTALVAGHAIVALPQQFAAPESYFVQAVDKTAAKPVRVMCATTSSFKLIGSGADLIQWIVIGTLTTQQGLMAKVASSESPATVRCW